MSTYAIGDIQGCYQELGDLLGKINFDPLKDTLWFTGDLINRGPQSLSVLRFIKSLGEKAIVVLGNHDLHFLAVAAYKRPQQSLDTLDEILSAPDCQELFNWLRKLPLIHYDKTLNFLLVHAGLPPQWDLTKALSCAQEVENVLKGTQYLEFLANMQGLSPSCWTDNLAGWPRLRLITNYLTRIRFCDEKGCLEHLTKGHLNKPPIGYLPWFKIPNRASKDVRIIFGHWAALEGHTGTPNIFALDTGCIWGKKLTAMRLEDAQLFSVPCAKNAPTQ